MRYVWIVSKILVFLLLLSFAVNNSQPVTLKFLLQYSWELPLVIILFIFFAAGAAVGLAAGFMQIYRLRRESQQVRRELRALQEAPTRNLPAIEDTLA